MNKFICILAASVFSLCSAAHAQTSNANSNSSSGSSSYAGGSSSGASAQGGSAGASAGVGDVSAGGGNAAANVAGNNANTAVTVNQAASIIPTDTRARITTAPSMGAPGLAAIAPFSCLGSTTAALSVMGGGIAGGSTHEDPRCDAREDAKLFLTIGFREAALARLCQIAENRKALEDGGNKCPEKKVVATAPVADVPVTATTTSDPYIRRRLSGN